MRAIVWLVLLAVAAVVAALTLGRNDGLVSIFWAGQRIDLSLNLFLLGLVLACVALMVAAQAVMALVSLPRRAGQWRAARRERAASTAFRESIAEFFSARYARAHKAAQRALALHADAQGREREFVALAHMLAAASLHRLQDRTRRDEQLQALYALLPRTGGNRRADDGARLLAAEWALEDREPAQALERLAELPPGAMRRTQALRLRLRATRLAGQPIDALHTARLLAKHQAFSRDVAQGLLRSLAVEALRSARDADQLRRLWSRLDASERRDPYVAGPAAEHAATLGAAGDAREWLRPLWERISVLDASERECVALGLAAAASGIGTDWLPTVEAATVEWSADAAIQYAAGQVFAERQLWGKARAPLEAAARGSSLDETVRRRAWMRLAALARAEGDDARARDCESRSAQLGL